MTHESKALFRTNTLMSGDVQCIIDTHGKVKFAPLTNSSSLEFDSNAGSYADNAAAMWSRLKWGMSKICNVQQSTLIGMQQNDELAKQFDMTYVCGCRYTKRLNVFRYFAPLLLSKTNMPQYFVVLRSDNLTATDWQSIIKDAVLVRQWRLKDIAELTKHQASMSEAACFVSHSSNQQSRVWGFDAVTAQYKDATLGAPNIDDTELSPYDFDAALSEAWRDNGLICSQIANLSFEFEDDTPGEHRYVGLYVSDAQITEWAPTMSLSHLPFIDAYVSGDALGLLTYIDGNTVKLPTLLDSSKLYTETVVASFSANDGLKPNTFTRKRTLDLELTGKMTPGEKFEIIVDGKVDVQVVCQMKDAGIDGERLYAWEDGRTVDDNQFLFGLNWQESIDRFIEAFKNASAKSTYDYTVTELPSSKHSAENNPRLRIETNCNSNDVDIEVLLPWSMYKKSTYSSQTVQFDAAVTVNNSLVISATMRQYLQTANALLLHLNDTDTIKVRIRQLLTLSEIDESLTTTDSLVVLVDDVLPDIAVKIAFDMLQIQAAQARLCKLHDVYDWSGFYESELRLTTNTEFDIDAWATSMTAAAEKSKRMQYVDAIAQHVKQLQGNSQPNAIKTLESKDSALIFSDSVYDRFDDLAVNDKDNKPNIRQCHFAAIEATDALNKQYRANNSIAFNCTGFAPYERLTGIALDSFNYSWFVEGSGCPEYVLQHQHAKLLCKSYATEAIDIKEFADTAIDVFDTKLTHKFAVTDKAVLEVPCYTYCYAKPDHITAFALFKGVEYSVSSSYVGWRFAVVRVDCDSMFECKPQLVINNKFKTLTVVLPFKVIDQSLINLDGILQTTAVDKSIYYDNSSIVALDDNKIAQVDVAFNCYPLSKTVASFPYKGATVDKPIVINDDGSIDIAIKVIALQNLFSIKDIFIVGTNVKLDITNWTSAVAYKTAVVQLFDVIEVNLLNDTEAIIWVKDIIPSIEYESGETYSWPRHMIQTELAVTFNNDIDAFIEGSVRPRILESMMTSIVMQVMPTMQTMIHRFAPIAFYNQRDAINALDGIAVMQKFMQQQIIDADPANASPTNKLLVNLTRYGTYCLPELTQVTQWSALANDDESLQHKVAFAQSSSVHLWALIDNEVLTVEQVISPLSTQLSRVWLDDSFEHIAGPAVFELCMFAAIMSVATTKTAELQLPDVAGAEQRLSLVAALAKLLGDNAKSMQYANYLIAKLPQPTLTFYDVFTGQLIMPIALNRDSSNSYITVQFEAQQGAARCIVEWQ